MLTEGIVAGNAFYIFDIIKIVSGIVALLIVMPRRQAGEAENLVS